MARRRMLLFGLLATWAGVEAIAWLLAWLIMAGKCHYCQGEPEGFEMLRRLLGL